MLGRRVRGVFRVTSDCSFSVTHLEAVLGSAPAVWWAADGPEPADRDAGFVLADAWTGLAGGAVYNGSAPVELHVPLRAGVGWDQVAVVTLREYDAPAPSGSDGSSDGGVAAAAAASGADISMVELQKLKPGPGQVLVNQPTVFDKCMPLADNVRLRWTLYTEHELEGGEPAVEVGLETTLAPGQYVAFGPASPGVTNRLMGGSDAAVVGYPLGSDPSQSDVQPFVLDTYITNYEQCNYGAQASNLRGVCEDYSLSSGDADTDNLHLVFAHRVDGVTLIRYRRRLVSQDGILDHPITPAAAQNFVWAVGSTTPGGRPTVSNPAQGSPWEGPGVNYHGPTPHVGFGEVLGLTLNDDVYDCPPLPEAQQGAAASVAAVEADLYETRFPYMAALDGGQVQFFWDFDAQRAEARVGVRALPSSGWVALAVGERMSDAYTYVAWVDPDTGVPRVDGYTMTGITAADVTLDSDSGVRLTNVLPRKDGGLSFELWLTVSESSAGRAMRTDEDVPLLWAVGNTWHSTPVEADTHFARSSVPTFVNLATGTLARGGVDAALIVHGVLMVAAWSVIVPIATLAARYLRPQPRGWLQFLRLYRSNGLTWLGNHRTGMLASTVLVGIALLSVVYEASIHGGRHFLSTHSLLGLAPLIMIVLQVSAALMRPSGAAMRRKWATAHTLFGWASMATSAVTTFTGIDEMGNHGMPAEIVTRWTATAIVWYSVVGITYAALELGARSTGMFEPRVAKSAAGDSFRAPIRARVRSRDRNVVHAVGSHDSDGSRGEPAGAAGVELVGTALGTAASSGASQQLSMAEVALHASQHDAWMVLRGEVYDVTDFVHEHPGGDVILDGVGTDATALFDEAHPYTDIGDHLAADKRLGPVLGTSDTARDEGGGGATSDAAAVADTAVSAGGNDSERASADTGADQLGNGDGSAATDASPTTADDDGGAEASVALAELAKHKSAAEGGAWLALRGVVYDVTEFIDEHPGGDVILDAVGTDGTALFDDAHPYVDVAEHLTSSSVVGMLARESDNALTEAAGEYRPLAGAAATGGDVGEADGDGDHDGGESPGGSRARAADDGPESQSFVAHTANRGGGRGADGVFRSENAAQPRHAFCAYITICAVVITMAGLVLWSTGEFDAMASGPVRASETEGDLNTDVDSAIEMAAQAYSQRDGPTAPWYGSVNETNLEDSAATCIAFPISWIGDGWCDAHLPFNSAACNWDGGDCCNITAGLYDCKDPLSPHYGQSSPKGYSYPAPRNPRYAVPERAETDWAVTTGYVNGYEWGFSKSPPPFTDAQREFLDPDEWVISIEGDVEQEMTLTARELIDTFHLEERLYRHRCVEAWSITVPWLGFPMAKLVEFAKPLPSVKYVEFTSWLNKDLSANQANIAWYPWPYTEALTIEEATNELAFVTTGLYQNELTPQNGQPIRITLPWKYGFKSAKGPVRVRFVSGDEKPSTFWWEINSREYGFWANVNPVVAHPRWSQSQERHLTTTTFTLVRIPTMLYNGYAQEVAHLYQDLPEDDVQRLWM